MTTITSPERTFVHSYLFLRRSIGVIGLGLPVVLIVGTLLIQGYLLDSISSSYYSTLRGVFVGSMCAVGVFLLSYHGYAKADDIAGDVAGIAAIGLALCPTTPDSGPVSATQNVFGTLHTIFAAIFFLTLVVFCVYFFIQQDNPMKTRRKVMRNGIYYTCGGVIFACLLLIWITKSFIPAQTNWMHPMLWLEAIAIWAFGFAWLVKGHTLLRDK
ncbi:MAG TPA: DUF998 domain-containing protein [Pseudonocardiaceae bacterium]|jgi:hypothetical protein|nr:DUF998 domain-containing protein [Pseudonocardiaceae bacterium]